MGVGFVKQVGFKLGVKERGSNESKEEEVTDEGTDELEMQELVPK